jgi:hypothetical protein
LSNNKKNLENEVENLTGRVIGNIDALDDKFHTSHRETRDFEKKEDKQAYGKPMLEKCLEKYKYNPITGFWLDHFETNKGFQGEEEYLYYLLQEFPPIKPGLIFLPKPGKTKYHYKIYCRITGKDPKDETEARNYHKKILYIFNTINDYGKKIWIKIFEDVFRYHQDFINELKSHFKDPFHRDLAELQKDEAGKMVISFTDKARETIHDLWHSVYYEKIIEGTKDRDLFIKLLIKVEDSINAFNRCDGKDILLH